MYLYKYIHGAPSRFSARVRTYFFLISSLRDEFRTAMVTFDKCLILSFELNFFVSRHVS